MSESERGNVEVAEDPVGNNPFNRVVDLDSFQGAAYIFTRHFPEVEGAAGMLNRYLRLEGDGKILLDVNVDIYDIAFLALALNKMLNDDIRTLTTLGNFNLLGTEKKRESFLENIEQLKLKAVETSDSAKAIKFWWSDEAAEQDEESI